MPLEADDRVATDPLGPVLARTHDLRHERATIAAGCPESTELGLEDDDVHLRIGPLQFNRHPQAGVAPTDDADISSVSPGSADNAAIRRGLLRANCASQCEGNSVGTVSEAGCSGSITLRPLLQWGDDLALTRVVHVPRSSTDNLSTDYRVMGHQY